MKTVDYLKAKGRMTSNCVKYCDECPLGFAKKMYYLVEITIV